MTVKVPLAGQVNATAGRVLPQLPLDSARRRASRDSHSDRPLQTRSIIRVPLIAPKGAPVVQTSGGTPPPPMATRAKGVQRPTLRPVQPQSRVTPRRCP